MRRWRPAQRAIAALIVATLCSTQDKVAAHTGPPEVHALLDVPYMPQTPELCGGASVAMVLRYWGERNVFPQEFSPLVDAAQGGIVTRALAEAVLDRGWQAVVLAAEGDSIRREIRSEIDRGRPLIALIEVAPGAYHYVVIVGSTDQTVVVHDPARAPFRVVPWAQFDKAWSAAGRWTLLVLPPSGFRPDGKVAGPVAPVGVGSPNRAACDETVAHSVNLALAGNREEAEQGLLAASSLCPQDPGPWRELAGLRFSQSRWSAAADLALTAARLAPEDPYAWQLAGTSRHLLGDTIGALHAWNHTGEPSIDAVTVRGAERTPWPVIVRASALQPPRVLTPESYALALRRLREIPSISDVRLRYAPLDGGRARVDVFVDERQTLPRGWIAGATLAARTLLLHELAVDLPGNLNAGERESAAWRWASRRPRVALALALPATRLPGILSLEGSWERQTYRAQAGAGGQIETVEDRQRASMQLADWATSWFRWQLGGALDRWREADDQPGSLSQSRDALAIEGAIDARFASDRFILAASGGWWAPLANRDPFGTGGLNAGWRSTSDATRASWFVTAGLDTASDAAPLALWPGAGSGQGRSGLLRAHSLLNDGVLDGQVFGRALARSSFEAAWPVGHVWTNHLSAAAFVDAAQAWHRLHTLVPSRLYLDTGVGVRIHGPASQGTVRIDIARGLRGGGTRVSAGWGAAWPH
jgi:hypothetical protein